MQAFALIVVAAAGVWLVGVAFLMALRPRYSLQLFEKMSVNLERSNWRLQFTEQGLRVLAGVALIVRAPASKLPRGCRVAFGCDLAADHGRPDPVAWRLRPLVGWTDCAAGDSRSLPRAYDGGSRSNLRSLLEMV